MDRAFGRLLLTCALGLAVTHARAAEPVKPVKRVPLSRFHILDNHLAQHLSQQTRDAIGSVARLSGATGFIVHQDKVTGRALLLTNEHVVRNGLPGGTRVRFFDAREGQTERVIHVNPKLDYALVEITPPAGGPVRPGLVLEMDGLTADRPIYTIAAYANLYFGNPKLALGGGRSANQQILDGPRNRYAIANGKVSSGDVRPSIVKTGGGREITAVISVLPNAPGMSGSPIFAKDTHKVIGLHSSGNYSPTPAWEESSVPMQLILSDLSTQLELGQLDAEAHRMIGALLDANR